MVDTEGSQWQAEQCVCVFLRPEKGIASQNWCSWELLPKASSLVREGTECWWPVFVLCLVLLPEFQGMCLGTCTTPWILLMSPDLQLRSIENADGRGREGWVDHRLCLCGCHPLLSGSRNLRGSSAFPAEDSSLKNRNLCKNAWSTRDCCYHNSFPFLSKPQGQNETQWVLEPWRTQLHGWAGEGGGRTEMKALTSAGWETKAVPAPHLSPCQRGLGENDSVTASAWKVLPSTIWWRQVYLLGDVAGKQRCDEWDIQTDSSLA